MNKQKKCLITEQNTLEDNIFTENKLAQNFDEVLAVIDFNERYIIINLFYNVHLIFRTIYTTKGRDLFYWTATPLKPYKVGNICYMNYRYSVLYFLNLSLKHFFSTENDNFCGNIQIRRPLSFRFLSRLRMPYRRTSQSKMEILEDSASVC